MKCRTGEQMNIKMSDRLIIKSAGPMGFHLIPDRIEDSWRWSVQLYGSTICQGMCKTKVSAFISAKQAARKHFSGINVAIDKMTI